MADFDALLEQGTPAEEIMRMEEIMGHAIGEEDLEGSFEIIDVQEVDESEEADNPDAE